MAERYRLALGTVARFWCSRRGFRFTTSYHTRFPEYVKEMYGFPSGPVTAYMRWFHGGAEHTLVPTQSVKDALQGSGFRNLVVWPRGVDGALFRPSARADGWYQPVDPEETVLVYVGRVLRTGVNPRPPLLGGWRRPIPGRAGTALRRPGCRSPAGAGMRPRAGSGIRPEVFVGGVCRDPQRRLDAGAMSRRPASSGASPCPCTFRAGRRSGRRGRRNPRSSGPAPPPQYEVPTPAE